MSFYRQQLESWLGEINVNADRVLDVGGTANPVRGRVRSFNTNEYICLDLGIETPKIPYLKFDINIPLVEQLKQYNSKDIKADCLFCLEVFEYVWNPVVAIKNLSDLLYEGGLAYISFPAIYPVHNPVEIDYLRYTKRVIELYCKLYNFSVIEITPRVATMGIDNLSQFYSKEGMHPVKGSNLPFDIGYMLKATKKGGDNNV